MHHDPDPYACWCGLTEFWLQVPHTFLTQVFLVLHQQGCFVFQIKISSSSSFVFSAPRTFKACCVFSSRPSLSLQSLPSSYRPRRGRCCPLASLLEVLLASGHLPCTARRLIQYWHFTKITHTHTRRNVSVSRHAGVLQTDTMCLKGGRKNISCIVQCGVDT